MSKPKNDGLQMGFTTPHKSNRKKRKKKENYFLALLNPMALLFCISQNEVHNDYSIYSKVQQLKREQGFNQMHFKSLSPNAI